MKKLAKVFGVGLLAAMLGVMLAGCDLFKRVTFSIKTEISRQAVSAGDSFTVTVTTTNTGDTYTYRGSTTKIGAEPVVYATIGGTEYQLVHDPIPMDETEDLITIEEGESIVQSWRFYAKLADGSNAPSGSYTLKLTFANNSVKHDNVIQVF